ncbi:hypothetical protein LWI28_009116 [Acer negundo]|uniref:Uncharacterized protein n=1 Tax=Acer negundo TaxID=4023 RepID=A0AAD5NXH9_ACENE|nr:hypothetical protein LWI28_009116 [Acer negundo]
MHAMISEASAEEAIVNIQLLISHLQSLNIEVEDLSTSDYYSVGAEVSRRVSAAESDSGTRGLVACGTDVGIWIFADKFPGVFAATCLTTADTLNARSISNCNVLAVSGMSTSKDSAVEILKPGSTRRLKRPVQCRISNPGKITYHAFSIIR